MFLFLSILIGATAFGVLTAGLLALLTNSKKEQNRWFFALSAVVSLWIPCNFIDSNVMRPAITGVFLKLDFVAALFIGWLLMEFVEAFSVRYALNRQKNSKVHGFRLITTFLNIALGVLIFGGLVFNSTEDAESVMQVNYSPIFIVYIALLFFYLLYAFVRLFQKRRRAAVNEKPALNFITGGLAIAVIANLCTNLLFPLIIEHRTTIKELNVIGYFGLLVFILCIYLAITTQKLFDVRPVVARSLGYILSLASVGAIFILGTFALTSLFFGDGLSELASRWLYTVFAVLLSFAFAPLKRFFDRLTSRVFYHDNYDSQTFLDQFNKILVSTFELDALLRKSADIIGVTIKPDYALFAIKQTSHTEQRLVGTKGYPQMTGDSFNLISEIANRNRNKVIAVEALDEKFAAQQQRLMQDKIAIIVRLAGRLNDDSIGYLILGPKKTGSLYSGQDLKVVEIIANELVIAIQNALRTQEIENFNLTLQQRVTDATRKLRRTNEKLKALDEAKDDFVSMASHQLRTPLTSIKGYTSMVLEGDAGKINATQRKLLEQSFVSSQRMVFLIADLLNVSRLKTGKFVIEQSPVNLADVVQQEIGQLKEVAAGRQLTLTYDKPETFPTLTLDETKTRQVIMNFVDNAIYYTPAGGNIQVKLVETPASVELRVVDDGIGVPKSEQPHLFTKFYRAGNARKARPDGTGLGLFMAKKVIVAEGGAIIFETSEGKGSTFGFVFSKSKMVDVGQSVSGAVAVPQPAGKA